MVRAGNAAGPHYLVVDVHYTEQEVWLEIVDAENCDYSGTRIHKNALVSMNNLEHRNLKRPS